MVRTFRLRIRPLTNLISEDTRIIGYIDHTSLGCLFETLDQAGIPIRIANRLEVHTSATERPPSSRAA